MSGSVRQSDQRSFLVLPENQLAVAAVKKLAPVVKRRSIRLVTLVGPAGVGKSHLARDLVRSWESDRTEGKVLVTTASQFAAQLADASSAQAISQFQTRFRNEVKLLVCEDVHVLGPRKESQQQLLAAIDDVTAQGGVVLLTSIQMPGSIKGLSRRLVNRMHGGLCVNIELPSAASRRKLIEHALAADGARLPPREIEQIAAESPVSPRELFGLLSQLRSETQLLTAGDRRRGSVVKALIEERSPAFDVGLPELCRVTAARFAVKPSELKGPRRSQTITLARQTAMSLARELLKLNYVEIGEYFNRGNHSTVIHACQKIAEQRKTDSDLELAIQSIHEELKSAGLRK
ncbi:helix-turn-helix domain-containing protein [Planctomicrobium piriforme]|uniref:Chromosomal replication initiator protein n=1 Tax=Planctomicrobium piriforme TaxID=1576369 RepID=A0A1I3E9F5_9PLAN|nr:DnaA/Hda family protein [Planctomicrobium piriforme]SFH95331.1 chromosomal replication initiator protein [Planctomicrobium piriforme]